MIRRATSADVEDLVRLEEACFRGAYAEHRWDADQFRYYLRHPRALVAIADCDGGTVGYLCALFSTGSRQGQVRLYSIAVLPRWRRRGIGTLLLDWLFERAAESSGHTVILEVAVARGGAHRFFDRAGFKRPRRLREHYGSGVDALRMRRRIGPPPRAIASRSD